jgi:beta-lactamase regulating signal transducer with metallopeptidase domain
MRKLFFTVMSTLCCMTTFNSHAGWWDSSDQQQINRLNGQLAYEQRKDDGQGVVIVILAVGTVAALGIGAAVGSKTRRDANSHDH